MKRRVTIAALLCCLAAAACQEPNPLRRPPPNAPIVMNPVVRENLLPGAEDWFVPYPQWAMDHEVEGYTDQPSYDAGQRVQVKVSATSSPVAWTLYRTGWYGGSGARFISSGTIDGVQQPLPPASTWDVPCAASWQTSFTVDVPAEAVSGVYAIKLAAGHHKSMLTFVVRNDDRVADLVFQRSDFTDAMYNNWDGADNQSSWYGGHWQWVSLDRVTRSPAAWLYPYSGGYFTYEYSMVRFLEREGYDVTYVSSLDVHQSAHPLDQGRAFLSVGHDEYWSPEMRDHVEDARDHGVNLALFSSDTCDGELRFKPDDAHVLSATVAGATAACPDRNNWSDKPVALTAPPDQNPSDTLTGTHYGGWCGQTHPVCADDAFQKLIETDPLTLMATDHPLLRNLLPTTAKLPHMVGYEYEVPYTGTTPLGFDVVTIGRAADITSDALLGAGQPVAVAYQHPSGARVFNAGSMQWSHGLDGWAGRTVFRNHGGERACARGDDDCFDDENEAVKQLTVNVLDDMGARRGSPSAGLVTSSHPCDWIPARLPLTGTAPARTTARRRGRRRRCAPAPPRASPARSSGATARARRARGGRARTRPSRGRARRAPGAR